MQGRGIQPTLEEAKAAFRANWLLWVTWARLKEIDAVAQASEQTWLGRELVESYMLSLQSPPSNRWPDEV